MDVKLQIKNVTHIELEPIWSDGDYLENLSLTVVDSLNDEVRLRLIPVADKKIDLMFADPPEGLDGLASRGFEEVTPTKTALMYARDSFIKHQVNALADFMREQVQLESEPPGVYDFEDELVEVMDGLRDAIAIDLNVALNQQELEL